mmetsp:Transcript_170281/g.546158  ORF Transcript_170281/g.546158 Transcript_170281/m.546158 type:complete len:211 (-) Transcript_170281:337-969(-)
MPRSLKRCLFTSARNTGCSSSSMAPTMACNHRVARTQEDNERVSCGTPSSSNLLSCSAMPPVPALGRRNPEDCGPAGVSTSLVMDSASSTSRISSGYSKPSNRMQRKTTCKSTSSSIAPCDPAAASSNQQCATKDKASARVRRTTLILATIAISAKSLSLHSSTSGFVVSKSKGIGSEPAKQVQKDCVTNSRSENNCELNVLPCTCLAIH